MSVLEELRFQPTLKHVTVRCGKHVVAESARPMLIWEPLRVVPTYAVPESDFQATIIPATAGPAPERRAVGFGSNGPPLLDPSVPFVVHTADGTPVSVVSPGGTGDGFRLADPALAGYVALDFDGFSWMEEDEPIVGHPRDPFHRIDVRRSSRHIRIESDGVVLADSTRTRLLFEGTFPLVRYYVPREDVRVELRPGQLVTACAYKGVATHLSAVVHDDEIPDIAWSYENPLPDAAEIAGLVAFYQERLDVLIDGEPIDRVRTPWS